MFKSVTSWLGVVDNKTEEELAESKEEKDEKVEEKVADEQKESESKKEEKTADKDGEDKEDDSLEKAFEEVSSKAINTAKEWGSYLYSFSKTAGKTVADKAKQFSKQVEDKTFLGDFSREQEKFVTEKKEKENKEEAAVPPWVGYNDDEAMKSQILALSKDRRNFLRNPPSGVQYQFDFGAMYPVAMATLQEDPNLQKMRFDLVPKQINEETFWKNYFYRVSLIKQSSQLTYLAQETGSTGELKSSDDSQQSSRASSEKDRSSPKPIEKDGEKEVDFAPSSPNENEFVSDSFQADDINDEEMRKEMQMLGMDDSKNKTEKEEDTDNIPQWEKELQQELQDYELVDGAGDVDDADIENEILQQIEQETNSV
ncbi:hypothetical protein FSP39_015282 [Pinctada imbricata]|uniref:BSD domain-containing protein n=1 Tax=Pinctada imbricata TaxID=66713 RepID=A0AA89C7H7_PINIB|nr:hypothetical protein FSP39_015282 [Pinctada imbricata]